MVCSIPCMHYTLSWSHGDNTPKLLDCYLCEALSATTSQGIFWKCTLVFMDGENRSAVSARYMSCHVDESLLNLKSWPGYKRYTSWYKLKERDVWLMFQLYWEWDNADHSNISIDMVAKIHKNMSIHKIGMWDLMTSNNHAFNVCVMPAVFYIVSHEIIHEH